VAFYTSFQNQTILHYSTQHNLKIYSSSSCRHRRHYRVLLEINFINCNYKF